MKIHWGRAYQSSLKNEIWISQISFSFCYLLQYMILSLVLIFQQHQLLKRRGKSVKYCRYWNKRWNNCLIKKWKGKNKFSTSATRKSISLFMNALIWLSTSRWTASLLLVSVYEIVLETEPAIKHPNWSPISLAISHAALLIFSHYKAKSEKINKY